MPLLYGIIYFLAGLTIGIAFLFRRSLSHPSWLSPPGDAATEKYPSRRREILRAAGAFLFLLLLDAVPDAVGMLTRTEPQGFFGPGFSYIAFFLGGWVAGRFGGRYGLASVVAYVLILRTLIPLLLIPVGLFFIDSADKSQVFVESVTEQWKPLLLMGPLALVFTLSAAMAGAWQVYGESSSGAGEKIGEEEADAVRVVDER
ncbi:MAG: hypothetical protein KY468_11450 [Armatimonadetes bacterium]|nr:hypothetical protein [Armatimonadota bacterium]